MIVIIGLIVAGVTAGQSLVKQAKLRSLVTDIDKYRVATNSFLLQYNGLPGDLRNATDYWPGVTNNANGNGNKRVASLPGGGVSFEPASYWHHLTLAGLIKLDLPSLGTGINGEGAVPGENIPIAYKSDAGISFMYPRAPEDGTGSRGNVNYFHFSKLGQHFFLFGKVYSPAAGRMNISPAITVKEALSIDGKFDDGLPNTGSIGNVVSNHDGMIISACRTGALTVAAQSASNEYNLANTDDEGCAMVFAQ